jgi:hypothetical protein
MNMSEFVEATFSWESSTSYIIDVWCKCTRRMTWRCNCPMRKHTAAKTD